jgi:hypothetical protein
MFLKFAGKGYKNICYPLQKFSFISHMALKILEGLALVMQATSY